MSMHSATAAPPSGAVQFTTKLPGDTAAVSTYYKRNVYDAADGKIGDVTDLIMGHDGKISTAVISVGGFLGVGEKEVAVRLTRCTSRRRTTAGISSCIRRRKL